MGPGDRNGDYVALPVSDCGDSVARARLPASCCCSLRWWAKVVFLCLCLSAVVVAFIIWGGPFLIAKVVVPILEWERNAISRTVLGLLLFASIALFPILLLPSAPSMWLSGISFGYGYGFLLIMAASSIGMSLPYFIGSYFCHKIHKWIEKWPKKAAIVRLAGEGNWFHQFRAVTLLRVSPFPYIIFNYAAVATNVKYGPYISGSVVGTVPDVFIAIYSGRLIRSLAEATNGSGFLSLQQVLYDVLGFTTALAATIAITIYAKRTLQTLQAEDELN